VISTARMIFLINAIGFSRPAATLVDVGEIPASECASSGRSGCGYATSLNRERLFINEAVYPELDTSLYRTSQWCSPSNCLYLTVVRPTTTS